jgi:pimeloyl-ACP methyl ester carboxylesterase
VVERDELLKAVWQDTFVDDHALSVQIGEVRKVLEDKPASPRYIETRHRRGYRFAAPVERVAAAAALASPFTPSAPPASEWTPPLTRYARSGDLDIAYQVIGEGPIDLVFVMGWVSHLEYFWKEPHFARFLRRLASFSRLILFDKRGTGLSDRVPISQLPTLEQRMDDVRAVMEAVDSQRAVLCGVSEGGPLCALFAATYPEKTQALVMIGTYAKRLRDETYPWGPTYEEREHFFEEIHRLWGGPVGIDERAPSLAQDAAFRDWWATYLRMGASPGAAVALTKMNADIDVRRVLPSVQAPALVLHRSADQTLKVEEGRYVAELIPRSRFIEFDGGDHLPFSGNQDELLDEIEQFLQSVEFDAQPERVLATVLAFDCGLETQPRLRTQLVREVGWFRGVLIPEGSGALIRASFDGPARAVRCAAALVRHAQRAACPARAALHTGECMVIQGQIGAGPAVDRAEALAREAPAGEVWITAAVRDLLAGSGLRLEPVGRGIFRVEA